MCQCAELIAIEGRSNYFTLRVPQALQFNCFDEPFASTVQIGRSLWQRIRLHTRVLDGSGELFRKLHISVVNDHLRLLFAVFRLFDKPLGLLADQRRSVKVLSAVGK